MYIKKNGTVVELSESNSVLVRDWAESRVGLVWSAPALILRLWNIKTPPSFLFLISSF